MSQAPNHRLACIQILQNLEARYINEFIGSAVILLTVITIGSGIAQLLSRFSIFTSQLQSQFAAISNITHIVLAVVLYFSLNSVWSLYLAVMLVRTILLRDPMLPKLTAMALYYETRQNAPYCGRGWHSNPSRYEYFDSLENISESQIAVCIRDEISNYLKDLPPEVNRYIKDTHVSAKILLTLSKSGFFLQFTRVSTIILLLISVVVILVLWFYAGLTHEKIFNILLGLLVVSLVLLMVYLLIAIFYKKECSPPVLSQIDERVKSGSGETLANHLKSYTERLSHLNSLICKLGLDRASRCCFLGYVHYCGVANDLIAPTAVFNILVALVISTFLILLSLN